MKRQACMLLCAGLLALGAGALAQTATYVFPYEGFRYTQREDETVLTQTNLGEHEALLKSLGTSSEAVLASYVASGIVMEVIPDDGGQIAVSVTDAGKFADVQDMDKMTQEQRLAFLAQFEMSGLYETCAYVDTAPACVRLTSSAMYASMPVYSLRYATLHLGKLYMIEQTIVGREPDEDVQPGEGYRLGGEGKWSALPDGQIGQRQRGQTVGTQNHQRGPLAPGRAVADRVPDRHQAVSKLLRVFFVQIKGDGSLGRLAHRVEHHPAGPEQPKEKRPLNGQCGQSFAPDDALPLGDERPPQPEHTGFIQRPAAGFQQDEAGPAEEEQKRGVLPQSCEQSVQAELQQGIRQRQQADDDRLAQEAEGGEGMVMPLSGHGASSARMWARSPACWAGMAGRKSFAPGAATMSSETPPSRSRGVRSSRTLVTARRGST